MPVNTITGDAANNALTGGVDNDILNGAAGADAMAGLGGDDTYYIDNAGDSAIEGSNAGNDTVVSTIVFANALANIENYTFNTATAVAFTGNALDNVITGGSGKDTLDGGNGNDLLFGNAGDDTLQGGVGNDELNGGVGADQMTGGAGNDVYFFDNVGDKAIEGLNGGTADYVYSTVSIAKLGDNIEYANLEGVGNLNLTGNNLDNTLFGNDGNNVIDGGVGADYMQGGKGSDTYVVDNVGDDVVENQNEGTDLVLSSVDFDLSTHGAEVENLTLTGTGSIYGYGNNLNNIITGNDGSNDLEGLGGSDTMIGGKGDDTYVVESTGDKVVETIAGALGGHDLVYSYIDFSVAALANVEDIALLGAADLKATGNAGDNSLYGNNGNNVLSGGAGKDTLLGEDGNDTLDGGLGADMLIGGKGDDTFLIDSAGEVTENVGEGTDTVISGVAFGDALANIENYTFNIAGSLDFFASTADNVIKGGSGADKINGAGGNDQIYGNAGNDALTAGAGNDLLDGGIGIDKMTGGAGNDAYYVDNVADIVVEVANQGTTDLIVSTVSIASLANEVEWAMLTGAGNLNLTGNTSGNFLIGNDGSNIIDGGIGADSMQGGKGSDTYIVDNQNDQIGEAAGQGTDLVKSSVTYLLAANVENLTLTGTGNIDGYGNGDANAITGNDGDNILNGNGGADTLTGGKGADTYYVDNIGDKVVETGLDGKFDEVFSMVDFSVASLAYIEALTLEGAANSKATGNAAKNTLTGNIGNNVLDGGAGADDMHGEKGDDTYYVDNINDVVDEDAGEGYDTVVTTVALGPIDNVENYTFNMAAVVNFTGDDNDNIIKGGSGKDILDGGKGNDHLYGNAGDDTLTGGLGNDYLGGGTGADTLKGGAGDDTYDIDNIGDKVIENANEGAADYVVSTVTIAKLWDNVESAALSGAGNLNLTGNDLANTLSGGSGNNIIDGGLGADLMAGSQGNDTYIVDNAGDQVLEFSGDGTDLVKSSVAFDLSANVENLTLTGTADIAGTGNSGDNIITGNDGDNYIDGGAGNDIMNGGKGDDGYEVDSIGDKVIETLAGQGDTEGGYDTVYSTISFSLANLANVEAVYLMGSDDINATGNAQGNTIRGNDGDNIIDGGASNDFMEGGKGDDTYYIEHANDYAKEVANEGNDTIISTHLVDFDANIENYTFNMAAAVVFAADAGDNILKGGSGKDSLTGGGGNDDLYGNAGNDILTTGSGDDILDGGAGIDVMTGGAGNDVYYIDNIADQVVELANGGTIDIISSSVSIAQLADNVEWAGLTGAANLNITGNSLVNLLSGNKGNNIIDGGLGGDIMSGGLGNDTYLVDNGSDSVIESANEGTDLVKATVSYVLAGNIENLTLLGTAALGTGNALDNIITGNDSANALDGGAGNDNLIGGKGSDNYVVDSIGDKVVETVAGALGGYDAVTSSITFSIAAFANVEQLSLTAGAGDAGITGNTGDNSLYGNDGNNLLDGGKGIDYMDGGKGDDTYYVDNLLDVVVESAAEGTDTIISTIAFPTGFAGNVENYTFNTAATVTFTGSSANNIIKGGSGADTLTGGGGTFDQLFGNAGNDTLVGGNGNDALDGGAGADKMIGGAGNDVYTFDNVGDTATEDANGGSSDYVFSSVSIAALGNNIEIGVLTGAGNLNITGNGSDNYLQGNAGNNVIDGGIGKDVLSGGAGNDIYIIDNVGDTVSEFQGEGTDLIKSSVSHSLASWVENLTLTGIASIDGEGNGLDNIITGNDGSNKLDGGSGNDTLIGGKGDDVYEVDSLGDKVVEAAGVAGGYDTVKTWVDAKFTNVEAVYLQGSANLNAVGDSADTWFYGNAGDNVIDGGKGADHLIGGAGDDTLIMDNIGDVVFENANEGFDTLISTIALTNVVANVEHYTFNTAAAITFTGNAADNIIHGGSGADKIDGAGGSNELYGHAGNDTLIGGSAGDWIDGGVGADQMKGGDGGDTYFVDNIGDVVTELASQGTDYVHTTVSLTKLFDNVEGVALEGIGNLNVIGNILDNRMTGNIGNNKLDGGDGNDNILGNGGDDVLTGGAGNDTFGFIAHGNDGHDVITDFDKAHDILAFTNVLDVNNDGFVTLADLFEEVSGIVDHGLGQDVDVMFAGGGHLTFSGVGSGAVDSFNDLVSNAANQILII